MVLIQFHRWGLNNLRSFGPRSVNILLREKVFAIAFTARPYICGWVRHALYCYYYYHYYYHYHCHYHYYYYHYYYYFLERPLKLPLKLPLKPMLKPFLKPSLEPGFPRGPLKLPFKLLFKFPFDEGDGPALEMDKVNGRKRGK